MSLVLLLLVGGFSFSGAWANPIVITHRVFMSAERLMVKVGDEAAVFDGRFHFRSLEEKGGFGADADVAFEVPIWLPAEAKLADARTAALLRASEPNSLNVLKDGNQAVWDDAVGLRIEVGRHVVKVDGYMMWSANVDKRVRFVEEAMLRKGYVCVVVRTHFPPAWLKGDPEIRVRYRQGLRLTRAGGEFFYLPMFDNMPVSKVTTTLDLGRYAMHVCNGAAGVLSLGTVGVPAGGAAVLPLADRVPVGMVVERKR